MSIVRMPQLLDHVAPALADLGLLTDEDIEKAHGLYTQSKEYQGLNRNAEGYVANRIAEAGDKLASDTKVSVEKVLAAATGIPNADAVAKIADEIEKALSRKARQIILARANEAGPLINNRLREISDETAQIAEALGGITDAQAAITGNRVVEWQTANQLQDETASINRLVSALRELKVLPAPTSATTGPWWRVMLPEDANSWLPAGASQWQRYVQEQARKPWVALSVAEVEAVRDQHLGKVSA